MPKKHRCEGDYFKALYPTGSGELAKRCDTVEEMREAIDKANATAVARGHRAEQFIITNTEWYKYFDANGQFTRREEYESVVEVYPEELG